MAPWFASNTNRAIPSQFQQTLNELIETLIKPETLKRDLFFALLLIVIKENDFLLKGSTKIDVVDYTLAKRTEGRTAYEVDIVLNHFEDTPAKIIVSSLGDTMLINAIIEASKETYSLCLPIDKYITTSSFRIPSELTNLDELYVSLKERIVNATRSCILNFHGQLSYSLCGLPNDVLYKILLRLSVNDILSISESCKKLKSVLEENDFWAQLFRRDFPKTRNNKGIHWRTSYKETYIETRRSNAETSRNIRENVIDESAEWPDFLPVRDSRWEVIL